MAASLSVLLLVLLSLATAVRGRYNLTLLHTNDVHARFLQTDKYSAKCSPAKAAEGKCFGGIARRVTKVREIRASNPNVLLVDAGDQYQGTLWFYVHRGAAAAHYMNKIRYDAMVSTYTGARRPRTTWTRSDMTLWWVRTQGRGGRALHEQDQIWRYGEYVHRGAAAAHYMNKIRYDAMVSTYTGARRPRTTWTRSDMTLWWVRTQGRGGRALHEQDQIWRYGEYVHRGAAAAHYMNKIRYDAMVSTYTGAQRPRTTWTRSDMTLWWVRTQGRGGRALHEQDQIWGYGEYVHRGAAAGHYMNKIRYDAMVSTYTGAQRPRTTWTRSDMTLWWVRTQGRGGRALHEQDQIWRYGEYVHRGAAAAHFMNKIRYDAMVSTYTGARRPRTTWTRSDMTLWWVRTQGRGGRALHEQDQIWRYGEYVHRGAAAAHYMNKIRYDAMVSTYTGARRLRTTWTRSDMTLWWVRTQGRGGRALHEQDQIWRYGEYVHRGAAAAHFMNKIRYDAMVSTYTGARRPRTSWTRSDMTLWWVCTQGRSGRALHEQDQIWRYGEYVHRGTAAAHYMNKIRYDAMVSTYTGARRPRTTWTRSDMTLWWVSTQGRGGRALHEQDQIWRYGEYVHRGAAAAHYMNKIRYDAMVSTYTGARRPRTTWTRSDMTLWWVRTQGRSGRALHEQDQIWRYGEYVHRGTAAAHYMNKIRYDPMVSTYTGARRPLTRWTRSDMTLWWVRTQGRGGRALHEQDQIWRYGEYVHRGAAAAHYMNKIRYDAMVSTYTGAQRPRTTWTRSDMTLWWVRTQGRGGRALHEQDQIWRYGEYVHRGAAAAHYMNKIRYDAMVSTYTGARRPRTSWTRSDMTLWWVRTQGRGGRALHEQDQIWRYGEYVHRGAAAAHYMNKIRYDAMVSTYTGARRPRTTWTRSDMTLWWVRTQGRGGRALHEQDQIWRYGEYVHRGAAAAHFMNKIRYDAMVSTYTGARRPRTTWTRSDMTLWWVRTQGRGGRALHEQDQIWRYGEYVHRGAAAAHYMNKIRYDAMVSTYTGARRPRTTWTRSDMTLWWVRTQGRGGRALHEQDQIWRYGEYVHRGAAAAHYMNKIRYDAMVSTYTGARRPRTTWTRSDMTLWWVRTQGRGGRALHEQDQIWRYGEYVHRGAAAAHYMNKIRYDAMVSTYTGARRPRTSWTRSDMKLWWVRTQGRGGRALHEQDQIWRYGEYVHRGAAAAHYMNKIRYDAMVSTYTGARRPRTTWTRSDMTLWWVRTQGRGGRALHEQDQIWRYGEYVHRGAAAAHFMNKIRYDAMVSTYTGARRPRTTWTRSDMTLWWVRTQGRSGRALHEQDQIWRYGEYVHRGAAAAHYMNKIRYDAMVSTYTGARRPRTTWTRSDMTLWWVRTQGRGGRALHEQDQIWRYGEYVHRGAAAAHYMNKIRYDAMVSTYTGARRPRTSWTRSDMTLWWVRTQGRGGRALHEQDQIWRYGEYVHRGAAAAHYMNKIRYDAMVSTYTGARRPRTTWTRSDMTLWWVRTQGRGGRALHEQDQIWRYGEYVHRGAAAAHYMNKIRYDAMVSTYTGARRPRTSWTRSDMKLWWVRTQGRGGRALHEQDQIWRYGEYVHRGAAAAHYMNKIRYDAMVSTYTGARRPRTTWTRSDMTLWWVRTQGRGGRALHEQDQIWRYGEYVHRGAAAAHFMNKIRYDAMVTTYTGARRPRTTWTRSDMTLWWVRTQGRGGRALHEQDQIWRYGEYVHRGAAAAHYMNKIRYDAMVSTYTGARRPRTTWTRSDMTLWWVSTQGRGGRALHEQDQIWRYGEYVHRGAAAAHYMNKIRYDAMVSTYTGARRPRTTWTRSDMTLWWVRTQGRGGRALHEQDQIWRYGEYVHRGAAAAHYMNKIRYDAMVSTRQIMPLPW